MTDAVLHLAPGDHVCAHYRTSDELEAIVEPYLAHAVAVGRRTMVFGREEAVVAYGDLYETAPQELVDGFLQAVDAAIADGHTGLAVAVDVTDVVRTPRARAAFAVVEHLADRAIRAAGTITGVCLYDARTLGSDVVAELAALHQRTVPEDTPFHLCAVGARAVRLDGELDLGSHAGFELGLAAVASTSGEDVIVDVSELDFIDVWSVHEFERRGRAARCRFVLQGARPIVRRLVEASRLDHVVVTGAR